MSVKFSDYIREAMNECFFPFGQKLLRIPQTDASPNKLIFVLGVYGSEHKQRICHHLLLIY